MTTVSWTEMKHGSKADYEMLTPLFEEHARGGLVSNLTSNPDWTRNEGRYARAFFPTLLIMSLLAHYGVEVPTIAYYSRSPPTLWWHEWCMRRRAKGRAHGRQDPPVLTTVAMHSGGSGASTLAV